MPPQSWHHKTGHAAHRASHQAQFANPPHGGTTDQGIASLPFNGIEDGIAALVKKADLRRQRPGQVIEQGLAGMKKTAGDSDEVEYQLFQGCGGNRCIQVRRCHTKLLTQVGWQIDPAQGPVTAYVLPEIGQLQSRANGIRPPIAHQVGSPENPQHQTPHRIGRATTILQQLVQGRMVHHHLVALEGIDEVVERLEGERHFFDGRPQRHKDRMGRTMTRLGKGVQLGPPPGQQPG